MITVLHGVDIVKSREKLAQLKEGLTDFEIYQFLGKSTSQADIIQTFESQSLFDTKKAIILEEFLETKDKHLLAQILNHLRKDPGIEVIFWEPKELKKEFLALFPKNAAVFLYNPQKLIFLFLDSLKPGNTKASLLLLHQMLETESIELVFYMLVRQMRILLSVSYKAPIDEVKRLAPWQRGRLERQATSIGSEKLLLLYKKLFIIEKETKTGANSMPAASLLDLFIASI